MRKKGAMAAQGVTGRPSVGYRGCNAVFTVQQEQSLVAYVKKAAAMYYGLPPKELLDGSLTLVFPEFPDLELVTILLGEPEEVVVTTEENEFSPENVRPFPRADPRKASSSRRKRNTEILTDTPVKEAMEEKKAAPKKVKRNILKEKKNGGKVGKQKTYEDTQCLVCSEWFSDSRPGEDWTACSVCCMWSHTACTPGGASSSMYTCHHCEQG
ncbi:unnamed protein product [Arctogadus glacialis]